METFSTLEVAKQVGVSPQTLERWIGSGKIQAPRTICIGCNVIRKWTAQDVGRVLTCKLQNYGKVRTRKAVLTKSQTLRPQTKRQKETTSMRRLMVWTKMPSGSVVTCSGCSWWTPVYGRDIDWVGQEFEFHDCADYPPLMFAAEELDKTG